MSPLVLFTIGVILVCAPTAVMASRFVWRLYREDREAYGDVERVTLSLVLAVVVTAVTVAGLLLAIPTVLFLLGRSNPAAGQLVLVAIDILLPAPLFIAGYLWWRRR